MVIIVSKSGKDSQKIEKSDFISENYVQKYITDNPNSIPLSDIKDGIKLLILTREFPTNSGPIDAIGIDRDGQIYIIETKLYKNQDKRKIVAQVLDYGASLWKTTEDFDDFFQKIDALTNKNFHVSLEQLLRDSFNVTEEEIQDIYNMMKTNLSEGSFKFVVLMDEIHRELKDIIQFLNHNSNFDIYAVELEFYKFDQYEIMIPKLFGSEIKKSSGIKYDRAGPRDEQYHFDRCDEVAKSLYLKLKEKLLKFGDDVKIIPLKKYIAFKRGTNFVDVQFQKYNLVIYINLKWGELNDSEKLAKNMSVIGHAGNGDYAFTIEDEKQIDYVVLMAKQSYDKN